MPTGAGQALGRPIFAASLLFAVILAATGAFGTVRIVLPLRLLYWMLVTVSAAASLLVASDVLGRILKRGWARGGVAIVLAALPTTMVAAGAAALLLGAPMSLGRLFAFYSQALVLNLLLLALLRFTARRNVVVEVAPPAPRDDRVPAVIASRLPPRLSRSRLLLVEAQDHYLRVATHDGEALIYMRFTDALAALEKSDGTRVHRSWWVARPAIATMKFASGRGELTLLDGTPVPVSRRFAVQAKELALRPRP